MSVIMNAITNDTKKIPDLGQNVSADLIDLYECCLVRDPSNRMSASKLLEHSFLQTQVISKYLIFLKIFSNSFLSIVEKI